MLAAVLMTAGVVVVSTGIVTLAVTLAVLLISGSLAIEDPTATEEDD